MCAMLILCLFGDGGVGVTYCLLVLQLPGIGVAKNATAKIEDVSKQMLNKIPVATFQVMVTMKTEELCALE